MDDVIELTGKLFREMLDVMDGISWSSSRKRGQRFFIEFDGERLRLYDKEGYTYFNEQFFDVAQYLDYCHEYCDEDSDDDDFDDFPLPEPFYARIKVGCLRGILKTIEEEYGEYDSSDLHKILMIRIFADKGKVYFQLLDRTVCGAYGMNIVCQCTFEMK